MAAILTRLLLLLQAGDVAKAIAEIVGALAGARGDSGAGASSAPCGSPSVSCPEEIDDCDPMIVEAEYDRRIARARPHRAPRGCFYME